MSPYKNPEDRKRNSHEYYLRNRTKILEQCKEYTQRPEVKEHIREYNKEYARGWWKRHPEARVRQREYSHEYEGRLEVKEMRHVSNIVNGPKYTRKIKEEVLGHYSEGHLECACCSEDKIEFLTIDHINGGGTEHRRSIGNGRSFYRWLKNHEYPDGFRVLCMNCNFSLGKYGYCPHHNLDRNESQSEVERATATSKE